MEATSNSYHYASFLQLMQYLLSITPRMPRSMMVLWIVRPQEFPTSHVLHPILPCAKTSELSNAFMTPCPLGGDDDPCQRPSMHLCLEFLPCIDPHLATLPSVEMDGFDNAVKVVPCKSTPPMVHKCTSNCSIALWRIHQNSSAMFEGAVFSFKPLFHVLDKQNNNPTTKVHFHFPLILTLTFKIIIIN